MQLLVIGKERSLDLKDILQYSLSPIPGCFSSVDGHTISKTTKSALVKVLEEKTPSSTLTEKPASSTVIVDTMALIQSMRVTSLPKTFGAFTGTILSRLTSIGKQFNAKEVHLVGDQYFETSIKSSERERRHQSVMQLTVYRPQQGLPVQWKKFLSSGKNKTSLQLFLAEDLARQQLNGSLDLVIALKPTATRVIFEPNSPAVSSSIDSLTSDHEEADTRLILHAKFAAEYSDSVVIWSPDTDVAVIAISHSSMMSCPVLFATGTGKHQRIINLTKISDCLGPTAPNLIKFHAFTGCDSTSSFHGKGKKKSFKKLLENPDHVACLAKLGDNYHMDALPPGMEDLVCDLYNTSCSTVRDARFELFKKGALEKNLPPNKDALLNHCKRVNYQAAVWSRATSAMMACPTPNGNGWDVVDGSTNVHWLSKPHAPPAILKTVKCGCKTGYEARSCGCRKKDLQCTALCSCVGSKNCSEDSNLAVENEEYASDSEEEEEDEENEY